METAMKVRRRILVERQSIRAVSRETGLSGNTIRKDCRDDSPPKYERKVPTVLHVLKDYEDRLTQWFEADLKRPNRERRTAQRLFEPLRCKNQKKMKTL